ncbi:MAG: 4'-phosphopantetheinyl transferase superfamily protein [Ignavibacteria bacterium]|nr:4'-phosphopantetheinyl transferase superfamily protein [Ignavibacteria bacterium]
MVEVFTLGILEENDFLSRKESLLELLPTEYRNFISRFRRNSSAQRSLFGELLLRHVLGQRLRIDGKSIVFNKTKNGKPYLQSTGIHFNLSHSGEYVAMALSDHETGIDVEQIRPINYRIAERFFSPEEVGVLNSKSGKSKLEYFFDLWTLKESYLKMIGTGLTKSLSSFTVELVNAGFRITEKRGSRNTEVYFKQYSIDDEYKLSVCSYNKKFAEKVVWFKAEDFIKV